MTLTQAPTPTTPAHDPVFSPELDTLLHGYWVSAENPRQRDRIRQQIVRRVTPYVRKIAHGLARRSSDPVEDLIQVGLIGLIKAIDKYNPLAGTRFKTYATYLITGEIRHYLRDKSSVIKAPRQYYELYFRMNQVVQRLTESLGRTPSDEEIAEALQCPLHTVHQVQDVERRRQPVSLDQFVTGSDGNETVYVERLVDDKYFSLLQQREDRLALENALAKLKPELRVVVQMSFFEDLSQTEIAHQLNISQMQVSRRLRKALSLLATYLKEEGRSP